MNARRELTLAALLCGAGAALTAGAGGRSWATVHAPDTIVAVSKSLTGTELTGAATALGWAGLAGLAALFAVRGVLRAGLGVLLAVFGAGIVYATTTAISRSHVLSVAAGKSQALGLSTHATISTSAWWAVSLVGGVLLVAGGLLTAVRGARWAGMSAKYERGSGPAAPKDAVGMWKALDRGEDPTR